MSEVVGFFIIAYIFVKIVPFILSIVGSAIKGILTTIVMLFIGLVMLRTCIGI